jgi:hypothetical protein
MLASTFYIFFLSVSHETLTVLDPNVDEASFLSSCSLSRLMLYGSVSYGQLMSCFHAQSGGKLYLLFGWTCSDDPKPVFLDSIRCT